MSRLVARLVLLVALLPGCGDGEGESTAAMETPVLPDLVGREEAVAGTIRRAHRSVSEQPTGENWFTFGCVLHAHAAVEEAERAYLVAAKRLDDPFEALHLAGLAARKVAPSRAEKHFRRALELRGDYMPLQLALADVLEEREALDEADALYVKALASEETSRAYLGRGRIALAGGKTADAIKHLETAARLDPKRSAVYAALARAYRVAGRAAESRHAGRRATQKTRTTSVRDPIRTKMLREGVSASALIQLAGSYIRLRRFAEASAAVERAIAARPLHADGHYVKAQLLIESGRTDEAIPVLRRVLDLTPKDAQAHANLGACLLEKGDARNAHAALQKSLALDPDAGNTHYLLAVILRKRDPAGAADHLEFVLKENPGDRQSRLMLATILPGLGRMDEAIRHARRLVEEAPNDANARGLLEALTGS